MGPPQPCLLPLTQLQEVWRFRHFLRCICVRDLKVKYVRSSLGFLWTLLSPLCTVAILVAVFRIVIRIQIDHYWAFLLSGYFVWNMIQQTLYTSASLLQGHAQLSRSVSFPKEVLIFGAALSKLIEFVAEMFIILLVILMAHHKSVPASIVLVPVLLIIQMLFAVGMGLAIATFSTLFTDVQHALPIVLTSLFYMTPIFYQVEMIPAEYRPYFFLNPFTSLLSMYHLVLYEGRFPSPTMLLGSAGASVLIFLIGYAIFNRYRHACTELI